MRRFPLALCVAALLVTAGCSWPVDRAPATATPEDSANVRVANGANATVTVDVWVLAGPLETVTVRRDDGTESTVNVSAPGGLNLFDGTDTAAVLLPDRARREGSYRLEPGSSVAGPVENLPEDPVVVLVVRRGDRVLAWLTAACGGAALVAVDLEMRDAGPSTGLECAGYGPETGRLSGPRP